MRIICTVAGLVLVGPSLNRNEDWIDLSCNYTRDLFAGAARIRNWRPAFRWFGKYFLPEIKRIRDHNAKASKYITEILEQRGREGEFKGFTKPNDAITWIQENLPENAKKDYHYQGAAQYVHIFMQASQLRVGVL